ncbi:MAG TPA: hypothetical protein VF534_01890 [Paraburkholderia sp.]
MSGYAYQWAKRQHVGDSRAKTVLKTYAHWASEDYSTWVTNEEMMLDTELNIQTIRKAREKLIALGFLIETKKRLGETRSIVVYQMLAPEGSTIVQSVDAKGNVVTLSPPSREEYESKPLQKRSPSKSGHASKRAEARGGEKPSPFKSEAPSDSTSSGVKSHVKGGEISLQAPPNLDTKKGLGLQEIAGDGFSGDDRTEENHSTKNDESENLKNPPTGFDAWWAVWPAATGRKQDADICRSHWDANGLDVHAKLIIAHTEAMKRTLHWRTGGDPTPIKYLERKRWKDCSADDVEASIAAASTTADGTPWFESTPEVIEARGAELGVRARKPDEAIASYRVLVVNASKEKSAVDFVLRDAKKFNDQRLYEFAVATFGDALMPTDFYA